MKAKVERRGEELIIVIPDDEAKQEGIGEHDFVIVRRAHAIDLMPLEEICARITPETLHAETDWGPDVGNEIIEW